MNSISPHVGLIPLSSRQNPPIELTKVEGHGKRNHDSLPNPAHFKKSVTSNHSPHCELLDVEGAAKSLSCTKSMIYKLVAMRELSSVRVGMLIRVPSIAIDSYIEMRIRIDAPELLIASSFGHGVHRNG